MPRDFVVGVGVATAGAGHDEVAAVALHCPLVRQTSEYFPPLVTVAIIGIVLGLEAGSFATQV